MTSSEPVEKPLPLAVDDRKEQLLLISELGVNRPAGEPGGVGYLLKRCAGQALSGEDFLRGIQQDLAGVLGTAFLSPTFSHGGILPPLTAAERDC